MLLESVAYTRPGSVEEALAELAANDGAALLAGGQSLLNVLKNRVASVEALVDISRLELAADRRRSGRLARDRRVRHLRRARPLDRCPHRPHDPGRCRRPHRGPADPQPRHDRRQLLPGRPDQQPAADADRARRDDEHPGAPRHARACAAESFFFAFFRPPSSRARSCARSGSPRSAPARASATVSLPVGGDAKAIVRAAAFVRANGTIEDARVVLAVVGPRPIRHAGMEERLRGAAADAPRRSPPPPRRSATRSSRCRMPTRAPTTAGAMARVVARRAVAEAIERGAA